MMILYIFISYSRYMYKGNQIKSKYKKIQRSSTGTLSRRPPPRSGVFSFGLFGVAFGVNVADFKR